jgi:hypothetical protein
MAISFYGLLDGLRNFSAPARVPSPSFETNNDSSIGGEWYNNEPVQENDISTEPYHEEIDIYNEDEDPTEDEYNEEEKEDDLSIS